MPTPTTSRAAMSALACLRAFPRLRRRTMAVQGIQEEGTVRENGCSGASVGVAGTSGMGLGYGYGYGARRWASSAAALAVREEEDVEESVVVASGSRDMNVSKLGAHAVERIEVERGERRSLAIAEGGNEHGTSQQFVDNALSALDSRLEATASRVSRSQIRKESQTGNTSTDARTTTSSRKAKSQSPSATLPPASPKTQELIWDTEHILDQALDTSLHKSPRTRKHRSSGTTRDLPWPTRHLKLRTVRTVDLEFAETAFNNARRRLGQLDARHGHAVDPVHRDVLVAHINHLLYLSARIPDSEGYARIRAYLREYDLEPDSHTYLTQLILMDKMNQMNQVAGICRKFNQRRLAPGDTTQERTGRGKRTIDGADATVLLNMTIWMLAKRGQWNIVGPAYNKLLKHTPHATPHVSAAFPRDYFTPSHDLSFDLYFRNTTFLDKITYQSLIRALAFHGNVVPALAVMQDLLNDSRGYTVALSDFVALFQGFARFGRIPVGWEDLEGVAYGQGVHSDAVYGDAKGALRPPLWEEEAPSPVKPTPESPMFPPPIFPEPSFPGSTTASPSSRSHKMDALKQMTEIWAGRVNTWDQFPESEHHRAAPTRLEREWTLVTLQQVFQSFLAIPPVLDAPQQSPSDPFVGRATKKWWEPSLAEAPSPRSIYYIMLAFSRTTDSNLPVLRAVWEHLENKFGEGNEEGWIGWRLDARLRRLQDWLAVGK